MSKLSAEGLRKLLNDLGDDPRILVPPRPGFDSGVHRIGGRLLVVSTDPCVGVPEAWFGWLLVHYVASDLALFGAPAEFGTITLLAPPGTRQPFFRRIMKQARDAAGELGMAIVAGHTARYEGVATPIGVCTAYGSIAEKDLLTPAGARPGDALLVAGPIGLEIAVNVVLEHPGRGMELFGSRRARELSRLVPWQSCAREALRLARSGDVRAMHDLTEGGLVAALNEVADASGTGFVVEEALLPIPEEVARLAEAYGLRRRQLLSMSSTGTFIAAVPPGREKAALESLAESGRPAAIAGRFTEDPERTVVTARARRPFPRRFDDPYERIVTREGD